VASLTPLRADISRMVIPWLAGSSVSVAVVRATAAP
jgi:hypothetical protein